MESYKEEWTEREMAKMELAMELQKLLAGYETITPYEKCELLQGEMLSLIVKMEK